MKAMKDCHGLYLKYDVLLLVDVFEKFRNNSLKNYCLFPSHYSSFKDTRLVTTNLRLEIIS